ncbi:hypothetical protein HWV62_6017 [Athelia sp. TMB]|nr:hypothetical protein HWV62_6017 [Athelia sp. TMB]
MLVLPVELREHILRPLPSHDLVNVRTAGNRALYELATPMAFRAIRIGNDTRGLEVFRAVVNHRIASLVQEVHVDISQPKTVTTSGALGRYLSPAASPLIIHCHPVDFTSMQETYPKGTMFASIASHFPSLSHLKISFGADLACSVPQAERLSGQAMLMDLILSNPQCRPSRLTSLTLHTMVFPWATFSSLLAMNTLSSLTHLDVHFNDIPAGRIPADCMSSCPQSIRHRADSPPWRLRHLKLTATVESIHFTPIDFTLLHFPYLETLFIENMTFRTPSANVLTPAKNPGAMEDFIIRHSTLRSLTLKDCMLVHTRRPWAAVYDRIFSALTLLTELSVDFGPPRREWINQNPSQLSSKFLINSHPEASLGYCSLSSMRLEVNRGKFIRDFTDAPLVVKGDEAALVRLKGKVKARAQANNMFSN